jgi:hypothetical protein
MTKKTKESSKSKILAEWKEQDKGRELELPELPDGKPDLVLTAYAYQKLSYWQALSKKNEVSCFGVATNPNDLLRVTELYIPQQTVGTGNTDMTADGIAEMYEFLCKEGFEPRQFSRIWIHTHPWKSAPSEIDYTTCREIFGECNWFVMLIKGNDGFTGYLYITGDMPVRLELDVVIDYDNPGLPSRIVKCWTEAFATNVEEEKKWVRPVQATGRLIGNVWIPDRNATP